MEQIKLDPHNVPEWPKKKDCGCKKKKLADPTRINALLSQAKKSGFTT
jgi:hypothetical protein